MTCVCSIASKLLHFARESGGALWRLRLPTSLYRPAIARVVLCMDPRTTTAVETMRIWQMRGGVKSMSFLVSNYTSSLSSPRGRARSLRYFRRLLYQFQDR